MPCGTETAKERENNGDSFRKLLQGLKPLVVATVLVVPKGTTHKEVGVESSNRREKGGRGDITIPLHRFRDCVTLDLSKMKRKI